jgi:short-subunit dehydrogenase
MHIPQEECVTVELWWFFQQGFAGLSVYCGTKYFVEGMSQAMRQEVAEFGVKVTCIQPGDVKTELFEKTTDQEVSKEGFLNLPLHILISCRSSCASIHRQHCRPQW